MPPKSDNSFVRNNEDPLSPDESWVFEDFADMYKRYSLPEKFYELDDYKEVKRLAAQHKDHTERSMLFDRIVQHIKSWFGENARVLRASEYDDKKNDTDLIVEFLDEDGKPVAQLSIDTTVPDDNWETIDDKFTDIVANLKAGRMGRLKYMPGIKRMTNESGKEGDYLVSLGRRELIPQVIVSLDYKTLANLCRDIKECRTKPVPGLIKFHPYQLVMLDNIVKELNIQREILIRLERARKINSGQKNIMDQKLSQMLDIISNLIYKKENPLQGRGVVRDDSWYDPVTKRFQDQASVVSDFIS
ncbi:MAG: hypothetical protein WAV25_00160 [Minisyncoccia bacterium]